ncbi:FecR domain-containing protein [Candidatus Binatia bacterium]|nr:FecR domain-containing protein [Candidatus Binatia bacterium]
MRLRTVRTICAGLLLLAGMARTGLSEERAGTLAAVQGLVTVDRSTGAMAGVVGAAVDVGDRISTDATGRAKLVLEGDSVLDLAPNTDVKVDRLRSHGRRGMEAVLQLRQGAVRVWVGSAYGGDGRYEVETPTAIVAARGTEFVVRYYIDAEVTEVLSVSGEVSVVGRLAVLGGAVEVSAAQYTQVRRGGVPTTPELLSDARLRQYVEGLEIFGTGRRDGLNVEHGLVVGRLGSPDDVPARIAGSASAGIGTSAPEEFLANRLSQDVRTNTQPLLDFERTPPGQVPPGSAIVDY